MIFRIISKSALLVFLLFSLYSCSYEGPNEIFDPNDTGSETPVITSIEPSDLALARYTQVKITGQNFASGLDSNSRNLVYFNNEKGTVVSESATEIIVIPPDISGESITIKISVPGALTFAEYENYRVELISNKSDAFLPIDLVQAIAVDSDENLYAGIRNGNTMYFYVVEPGKDKIEFATARIPVIEDMKIGPNKDIYFVPGNRDLYKIPSGSNEAAAFIRLPKNVKYFDFDQNKNIYIGGSKTGMFRIATTDSSVTEVGSFTDFDLKSIRVFDGYVYYSANYSGTVGTYPLTGVWKSKISETDGSLSDPEVVFDWSTSGSYSLSKIGTITLAMDGTLFIGCDSEENPILVVNASGNSTPLYSGLLFTKTVQFVWGNTNTIYHNVVNSDEDITGVYEILVTDWESAPYYGRE
ncbi:MAG: IPT/TIG domain-containing protein [Ignavibacteriales bacterium]|nr:IPT/TIG domain-containing protein [Ignavibacteriales bacterium]MCB9218023.1 IPT/TIG domain-containing protein [Ignavibacteriales bacterium]MCB9260412.1 IPT/TIG domain-containing protein [Ignavibacteriales bacterium]